MGCAVAPMGQGQSEGTTGLLWGCAALIFLFTRGRRGPFATALLIVALAVAGCGSGRTVTTLAGSGGLGSYDGTGAAASFTQPNGIVVDGDGLLFVGDFTSLRRIDAQGVVTTVAGGGLNSGYVDGPAATAEFFGLTGLALDGTGMLLAIDVGNRAIRRLDLSDGSVSTLSGGGPSGEWLDGPIATARFATPFALAIDGRARLAYVSDFQRHTIRRIDLVAGVVSTLAGNGEPGYADGAGGLDGPARFNRPLGLAVDQLGRVWVADSQNHVIRRITPEGEVSTVAGGPGLSGLEDGPGKAARFNHPRGLALGPDGNLYATDENKLVRQISPDGQTRPFAGKRQAPDAMPTGVDGTAEEATFESPGFLAVGPDQAVYVVDKRRIRVIR